MGLTGGRADSTRPGGHPWRPTALRAGDIRPRSPSPSARRKVDRDRPLAVAGERRRQPALRPWLEDARADRRPGRGDARWRRGPHRPGPCRTRLPSMPGLGRQVVRGPIEIDGPPADRRQERCGLWHPEPRDCEDRPDSERRVSAIDGVWRRPAGADTVGRARWASERPPRPRRSDPCESLRTVGLGVVLGDHRSRLLWRRGLAGTDRGTLGRGTAGGAGAVRIVDFGFAPPDLSVAVDSTVTWTNTG